MRCHPPLLGAALFCLTAACGSLGPRTIPRDRFDYGEAISNSMKEQMLLNIIKLRYVDMPMFVEVSSVINQYALSGEASMSSTFGDPRIWSAGTGVRFEDRPTITYSPILGKEFTVSLLTPVPPGALLFLIQSGWPVDLIFRICVQTVNGIHNRGGSTLSGRINADPRFDEVIERLMAIQSSGQVGLRIEGFEADMSAFMVIRRTEDQDLRDLQRGTRSLLGLNPDAEEFRVSYGSDAVDDTNIAMLTRSVFEILIELAKHVSVDQKDIDEQRTGPNLAEDSHHLLQVHHGSEAPDEAFVSIHYRDQWFWLDDRDLISKRTFAFVLILFNLTQTGSSGAVPLLTVGAS
jgi:hypothetical protein